MEDADSIDGDSRKRYSAEEVEENPKKRINKEIVIHLKILIHTNVAGIIIGRGGETIGSIQKDTDAKIKLSKSNEFFPGTQERVCLISGNKESVLAAFCIINNKVLDEKRTMEGRLRLLVPNSLAGVLIGKNGSYITQIKQQCRVKIEFSTRKTDKPNYNAAVASTNERILTMGGRQECIEQALTLILDKMVDCITNYTPILTLVYGNWDHTKSENNGNSSKTNPSPFASSLSGINVPVDTPNLNTMNMGMGAMNGYDSHALKEISHALGTLAKYGILNLLTATSPTLNMLISNTTGAHNVFNHHRERLYSTNNNNTSPHGHHHNGNGGRSSRQSSQSPSRQRRDHKSFMKSGGSSSSSLLGQPGRDQAQQSLLGERPEQSSLFPPLRKASQGMGEQERDKVIASILEGPSPTTRLSSSPLVHWDTPPSTSILGEAPTHS